jgi:predicted metal-dependent phosphoesterase TrpH
VFFDLDDTLLDDRTATRLAIASFQSRFREFDGESPEAFSARWLAPAGRAHIIRYATHPVRAVQLINSAGGVAVIAHPRALGKRGYAFDDELIEELAAAGLAGIEVDHPDHTAPERVRLRSLAGALDLAVTGSSDDHGDRTGNRLGCESTTEENLQRLLGARSSE